MQVWNRDAIGWGVRRLRGEKSIHQNPLIKIHSSKSIKSKSHSLKSIHQNPFIKIHWFKIHWFKIDWAKTKWHQWIKYRSVLVLLFQWFIPNWEIAADNTIFFFNSNCSAMDKTLEFSSRLFSNLKIQMEQSLKKDKFKEEIHQEAEQMAFFDRSQISFIQLLINIGKMYTIVS